MTMKLEFKVDTNALQKQNSTQEMANMKKVLGTTVFTGRKSGKTSRE